MKRMSCLPLSSSALRQPISGRVATAAVLMGERTILWANHRPNAGTLFSWLGLISGIAIYSLAAKFFANQFLLAQAGRLIRDQIIPFIPSGRYREILC